MKYTSMRNKTIGEIFDEMCMKQAETTEDIVYLYRMRNPLTGELMDLRIELE